MVSTIRSFPVTLDVADPIGFCADRETEALMGVRRQYEKVCFQAFYIEEILGLDRVGRVNLIGAGGGGSGMVHVEFRARVYKFRPGYPILGVRDVAPAAPRIGRADRPPVAVPIRQEGGGSLIGPDQVVPVTVVEVSHTPMKTMACAVSDLLQCATRRRRWAVSGSLTAGDVATLRHHVEALRSELDRRAEARVDGRNKIDFFENLLATFPPAAGDQPISNAGTWEGPPAPPLPPHLASGTMHLITALASEPGDLTGVWERPLEYPRSCPVIVKHAPEKQKADPPAAAPLAPLSFVAELVLASTAWLRCATDLPTYYPEDADIKRHANIWAYMKQKQLPRE